MIPNSAMLQLAIIPLREPERVELRARFAADTTPGEVQEMLQDGLNVPVRYAPEITLEELDRDEVVVSISATPERPPTAPSSPARSSRRSARSRPTSTSRSAPRHRRAPNSSRRPDPRIRMGMGV